MENRDIIKKLRNYQYKLYGDIMRLDEVKFECNVCKVHFTPGSIRAKELMEQKGVINECKECEKGKSDVY